MPHDVTMPQLGMAQDAGRIVAWLKKPGEKVARGEALFEVETDKATMEVEAQSEGFLTDVSAAEGDDVPVGHVIARISDTAEDSGTPAKAAAAPAGDAPAPKAETLPDGRPVTMPQLGMAQDTGLIVAWHVAPGDEVAEGAVLFEVETDKATMEVEADGPGFVAALLAGEGEEVPVGERVAILSAEKPAAPVRRTRAEAPATELEPAPAPAPKAEAPAPAASARQESPRPAAPTPPAAPAGRVLASPKVRRLALELGLDLARLAEAGHPQPFHVRDLESLKALPAASGAAAVAPAGAVRATRRITAEIATDGFMAFAAWAAEAAGTKDDDALLAGFAAASLRAVTSQRTICVAVERFGTERRYVDPDCGLGQCVADTEAPSPDLVLRDLRHARVTSVESGGDDALSLTVTKRAGGLAVTLDCAADQLTATQALLLAEGLAGRLEEPLRHLL